MKKAILVLILSAGYIFSCKNQDKDTSEAPIEDKTIIKPATEDDKNSISNLEAIYSKQINGLWKLYKTVYPTGNSMVERGNSFIEIKSDKKFDDDNRGGYWFLSFCKDSAGVASLFTKVQPYGANEVKIIVSKIEKTIENGTTYLKLTALTDGEQSYYIRQQ